MGLMNQIKEMLRNKRNQKFLIMACYFVFLLMWMFNLSFDGAPDERMRFQIPKYIFDHGRLPTLFDKSIIDEKYGFSYASQPCLPYIIGALFMRIASMIGISNGHLFYAARLVSVISGVLFLFVIIKIADQLFDDKISKYTMVGLIMFWPQLCFVFSYVNCDSVALVGVAIIILAWIKGVKSKWSIKDCVCLAIGISIVALSYINGFGFVLVSILIFIASFVWCNKDENKYKKMILRGLLICGIVLLLASWFYIRNIYLYHDLFGSNVSHELSMKYATSGTSAAERHQKAMSYMGNIKGIALWFALSSMSFFGRFGHMEIAFSRIVYLIVFIFVIIVAIFATKNIVKRNSIIMSRRIVEIGLLCGLIITVLLSFIYSFSEFQPQGRYLLPAIISFTYFMTLGLDEIRKTSNVVLGKLYITIPLILLMIDLYVIFFMLI